MADTLTITDNRTGKQYEVPIKDGAIRAMDLRQIKTAADDFGLMTYDPAFHEHGGVPQRDHLHRRRQGHPATTAATPSSSWPSRAPILEVAYLHALRRAADDGRSSRRGRARSRQHTMLHENIKKLMDGFQYDAHPMGIFLSTVGALSTFYPDAKQIFDEESRAAADSTG